MLQKQRGPRDLTCWREQPDSRSPKAFCPETHTFLQFWLSAPWTMRKAEGREHSGTSEGVTETTRFYLASRGFLVTMFRGLWAPVGTLEAVGLCLEPVGPECWVPGPSLHSINLPPPCAHALLFHR